MSCSFFVRVHANVTAKEMNLEKDKMFYVFLIYHALIGNILSTFQLVGGRGGGGRYMNIKQ